MTGLRSARGHRLLAAFLATTFVSLGVTAVTAAPASAICAEPQIIYSFTTVSSVWKATNSSSAYIRGPGTVSLAKGKTYTASASMTATVSAEAGIVFAKASASLGVTVGASYSGSQVYTYTLNVPSGLVRHMQQYKKARKFTVNKYRLTYPCNYSLVYSSTVIAPVSGTAETNFLYALAP